MECGTTQSDRDRSRGEGQAVNFAEPPKLGIDPWRYLSHALLAAGSGMTSQDFVAGYTPWAWAEQQAKKQAAEKSAAGGNAVMA